MSTPMSLPISRFARLASKSTGLSSSIRSLSSSTSSSSFGAPKSPSKTSGTATYGWKQNYNAAPKPPFSKTKSAAPAYSSSASSDSPTSSSSPPPPVAEPLTHPFAPEMFQPDVDGNDGNTTLNDFGFDSIVGENGQSDWSRSLQGLGTVPFDKEARDILLEPIPLEDIEVKPDGIVYLPEIKYRRILNRAFGPGAWGLAPWGQTTITPKLVTREYGLVVHSRLVSIARGEQQYFDPDGIPTSIEGCKSNALMRCCKDLGIASELWDPVFLRAFLPSHTSEVWVEHVMSKKKRKITIRKGNQVQYPYKLSTMGSSSTSKSW